jgi:hypothetical protein
MSRFPVGRSERTLDALRDALEAARVPGSSETLVSGASPVAVSLARHLTTIVTGGTAGTESVTVGDGTGEVVGTRKLIELGTRTDASDVVSLDHANIVNASGTQTTNVDLDAEGEFVLLEWNGSKWQIVYSDATVAV